MASQARTPLRRASRSKSPANEGFKPRPRSDSALDPQLQNLIGEQLRLYYADLLAEPIPDHLVKLLDRFLLSKERLQ
jgi:hypothetical protein